VCGVEVGSADNATYCRGVQPITIEPMDDVESMDMDNVQPLTSVPAGSSAAQQNAPNISRRPGAGVAAPVAYCGTLSGDELQQLGGDLVRNLSGAGNSSVPPVSNVLEPRGGRSASLDSTPGQRPSVCVPADSVVADSSTPECSRAARQLRRSSDKPSPQQPMQSTTDSSSSGSSTGCKSAAVGSKSRRSQSLDGRTSTAVQQRG